MMLQLKAVGQVVDHHLVDLAGSGIYVQVARPARRILDLDPIRTMAHHAHL